MMLIVAFLNFVDAPKNGAFHTVNMYLITNVFKIICSGRKLICNTKYLQCSLPGCNVMQSDACLPNHSTLQHSTILIAVRTSYLKHMSRQLALISRDTVSYLLNIYWNVSQNAFVHHGTSCCLVQFEQKLITVNELQDELPSEQIYYMKPNNKVLGLSL
jgi:hypothetical protein